MVKGEMVECTIEWHSIHTGGKWCVKRNSKGPRAQVHQLRIRHLALRALESGRTKCSVLYFGYFDP